jgi:hypothetical protein
MAHTGVCLGSGKVSEARGHAYGVIESDLAAYPWTDWGELDESKATGTDVGGETNMSIAAGTHCTVANLKGGTTKLNVRATASVGARIVAVISAGEQVTCLSDDGTWAKIETASGVTGYCMSQYLQAADDADDPDANSRIAALEKSVDALAERVATLEAAAGSSRTEG